MIFCSPIIRKSGKRKKPVIEDDDEDEDDDFQVTAADAQVCVIVT